MNYNETNGVNQFYSDNSAPVAAAPQQAAVPDSLNLEEETDNSKRPPNAFILYTLTMRNKARQENPTLSNTEISSLLGKWWKVIPNEEKLRFKQQATMMQEKFKREHPDYTYRKARRKRALNELLTKSQNSFGFQLGAFPAINDLHETPALNMAQQPNMNPFFMSQPQQQPMNQATNQLPMQPQMQPTTQLMGQNGQFNTLFQNNMMMPTPVQNLPYQHYK